MPIFEKDGRRGLKIDYFSMVCIFANRVRFTAAALEKKCLHKCAGKYDSRGPLNKHAYFLPIVNYPQFILNQYQEVGQKPAHTVKVEKWSMSRKESTRVEKPEDTCVGALSTVI